MTTRDAEGDGDFEYLVNLLASDGVEAGSPLEADATGSRRGNGTESEFRIQRGSNGKLDLGQVRAFYEKKNRGLGKEKEKEKGVRVTATPWSTDHSQNLSGW
jgi:hypothetical protein